MNARQLKNALLQQAIEGRLVPQNPDDEPAAVLLQRIRAEKARLIQEGKIKKQKPLPPITDEEKPFPIPASWEWVRLGEVANLITSGSRDWAKFYSSTGAIFLRMGNLSKDSFTLRLDKVQHVKLTSDTEGTRTKLQEGDLLFSITGDVGLLGLIPSNFPEAYINQHTCLIRFNAIERNRFIPHVLTAQAYKKIFHARQHGIKNSFKLDNVAELLLPLPPLEEQKRIVAKLEEILPEVEEYGRAQEELNALETALPGRLRKSLLQEAVEGRLVPQNPDDEPAAVLLQRIRAEKARLIKEGKIKKQKPLPPITDEEKPFPIPASWEWVRLGEVVILNPRTKEEADVKVSFIPMNLIKDGFSSEHESEIRLWGDVKSGFTHFKNGDIGIAKITPCFQNRKSVIFQGLMNGIGAGTTELHILRTVADMSKKYLLYLCKTQWFISEGVKTFTGTAGQQRVGKDFIALFPVPLPPLEEQKRIVAKLEEVLPLCAWGEGATSEPPAGQDEPSVAEGE